MKSRLTMILRNVSVRRGETWALRDVSLEFPAGTRWALIGGNGAGKTQLLKLLCASVWPTPTGREARIYRLGRREIELIDAKPRIAYVGAELQDKYARYGWDLCVADLVLSGMHRTDLLLRPGTTGERRRASAMLTRCDLTGLSARRFLTLSYGQKRIALLARALVQDPDWLLLDEFYNGLDAIFRRRVDGILRDVARRGRGWIAAAHRAADVPTGTRGLIELRAGRVRRVGTVEEGGVTQLSADARDFAPAKPAAAAGRRSPPRGAERERERAAGARRAPLVRLSAVDLYVDYRRVLRNVDWELGHGEHWAVFGANGAGKSSLLKLLYGDLSPALGGNIERAGHPRGTPIAAWKRRVGYVSPELQTDYAPDVSVHDLVASGRHASVGLNDPATASDRTVARRWLEFFGLRALAQRRPRELSYGQLRRALIARALAAEPRLLLLDEPFTGLDPRQRAAMKRLLERLMARRLTLVIAVHHPEDLPRGVMRALELRAGRAHPRDLHSATSVSGSPARQR